MKINKINSDFQYNNITIQEPKGVQGGLSYTTKIMFEKEPLFIQTKKCVTKNGFVTTGKKTYIDLMFSRDDEYMLEWIENLEERLQDLIYENSSDWFENELSKSDIEDSFLPSLKPYKSGKYYLLRCFTTYNINNITSNNLKIYDEDNNDLSVEDIKENSNIITILQVNDIKFTSKNFQIDFLVKQVMLINEVNIINDKLITKETVGTKQDNYDNKYSLEQEEQAQEEQTKEEQAQEKQAQEEHVQENQTQEEQTQEEQTHYEDGISIDQLNITEMDNVEENELTNIDIQQDNKDQINSVNINDIEKDISLESNGTTNLSDNLEDDNKKEINENDKTLDKIEVSTNKDNLRESNVLEEKNDFIEEVNLNEFLVDVGESSNNLDEIKLKNSKEVYMEIYKTAKDKAKIAKENAIKALLEMNNIKQKYNLMDILESDDEEEINL